jgi:hypothetical protein
LDATGVLELEDDGEGGLRDETVEQYIEVFREHSLAHSIETEMDELCVHITRCDKNNHSHLLEGSDDIGDHLWSGS